MQEKKKEWYLSFAYICSVPENKQHMVLPEIEEEDEEDHQRHSKLSLTSLLLGKFRTTKPSETGYRIPCIPTFP